MVAKITTGKNIRGALIYNENKVAAGEALLILASGFATEITGLDFSQKLRRFEHLTKLKPTVMTNAVHISLNFHSNEVLDKSKIQQIAIAYLDRIGFGEQPYLVYQHYDAAHQHAHLVTTNIQRDGSSINMHNLGRTLSEQARKSIESDFGLLGAQKSFILKEVHCGKPLQVHYGKNPTKRAISNVVSSVMTGYHYSSFSQYAAALKSYNIIVDRGEPGSRMNEKKGLQYAVFGSKGEKIGVPLKASSFYSKPTLINVEKRFERNKEIKSIHKNQILIKSKSILDKYITVTENTLLNELLKHGIYLNLNRNREGFVYGATFVDHQTKTVFKGSDLSKALSASELRKTLGTYDEIRTYLKPIDRGGYLKQDIQNNDINISVIPDYEFGEFLNAKGSFEDLGMLKKKKKKKGQEQHPQ